MSIYLTFQNVQTNSFCFVQNEQLRQDVIDYQRQIDSQKESLLSQRGDELDYRSQLSKKNFELVQYLDEIQVNFEGFLRKKMEAVFCSSKFQNLK